MSLSDLQESLQETGECDGPSESAAEHSPETVTEQLRIELYYPCLENCLSSINSEVHWGLSQSPVGAESILVAWGGNLLRAGSCSWEIQTFWFLALAENPSFLEPGLESFQGEQVTSTFTFSHKNYKEEARWSYSCLAGQWSS